MFHTTGDNLNIYFQATQDRWGLDDTIEVIVTDNASNITNVVDFSEHKIFDVVHIHYNWH